jgi:hypothetical protein
LLLVLFVSDECSQQLNAKVTSGSSSQASQSSFFSYSATFSFRSSPPNPELLLVVQRVLETLRAHVALRAYGARRARRTSPFRKEDLRIDFGAARVALPLDWLQESCGYALHSPAFLSDLAPHPEGAFAVAK